MITQSFVCNAARLFMGAALGLAVGSAGAAPPIILPVQVLDPNNACASWTVGGTVLAPTLTCVPAGPVTPGAPVCQLTANNQNPLTLPAGGGTVALNATCTNAAEATTQWAWTGPGVNAQGTGASPQAQSLAVSQNATFSVTATNGTGSGSASVNVTVGAVPPPGGALFPPNGCGAPFTKTLTKEFDWGALGNMRIDTVNLGGMGNYGALVATFVTPDFPATATAALLGVGVVPYPGNATQSARTISISTSACDFGAAYPLGVQSASSERSLNIALVPYLRPNTRYYVNISNTYRGTNQCTGTSCDLRLEITKPTGY